MEEEMNKYLIKDLGNIVNEYIENKEHENMVLEFKRIDHWINVEASRSYNHRSLGCQGSTCEECKCLYDKWLVNKVSRVDYYGCYLRELMWEIRCVRMTLKYKKMTFRDWFSIYGRRF